MRIIHDTIDADRSSLGPRIRVIGAGLPRCATSSLQEALESPSMGYAPCMHMAHVVPHAHRSDIVLQAMREKDTARRQKLLHKIFDGYEATTDFPGFWFIEDLMDMYPDAAIILNQRKDGGEAWWRSLQESLGFFMTLKYYAVCFLFKSDRNHYAIHEVAGDKWFTKYGCPVGPGIYDKYQSLVLREAKKRGREVLIWKAEDGWGPICEFLGKEVPKSQPFPWSNDAATMRTVRRILVARGLLSWVGLVGGLYGAWRYGPGIWGMAATKLSALWSR
ncbi:hypothetical protein QQS21_004434 [Conoideocrella luteorostrata]|uniref:Tpr repeat containing protein n=1 Tax=Conoideocrella luteorostrata TaxID=1105319 RepID=A0AAJ0FUP1_9HYPO|nr:hypothetical protein QQS21_004434 [Conoideocrella luteorostrata]